MNKIIGVDFEIEYNNLGERIKSHPVKNINKWVILFLDIPRQFDNIFINMLNKTFLYCIKFNTTIDTIVENANKFDEKWWNYIVNNKLIFSYNYNYK